jgi:hypothetical protein
MHSVDARMYAFERVRQEPAGSVAPKQISSVENVQAKWVFYFLRVAEVVLVVALFISGTYNQNVLSFGYMLITLMLLLSEDPRPDDTTTTSDQYLRDFSKRRSVSNADVFATWVTFSKSVLSRDALIRFQ